MIARVLSVCLCALLISGCATVKPLEKNVGPVQVLSFALSRTVTFGTSGDPEPAPAILGGDFEAFNRPLRESANRLWAEFGPRVQELTGRGPWLSPQSETEHPLYVAASFDEVNPFAMNFLPPRARGYFWPEGFRYLDSESELISRVAPEFESTTFLTADYRAFLQNTMDEEPSSRSGLRVGLVATYSLYDATGVLLARDTLVGLSTGLAERRGGQWNRPKYPELLSEAQEDILRQWSRKPIFRTEN